MDVKLVDNAVELVKQREGILNSIQDKYITAIVNGVIEELERVHHIKADMNRMDRIIPACAGTTQQKHHIQLAA